MRRNALLILLVFVMTMLAAACTDDEPSDISGCEHPEGVSEAEIYTNDGGCAYGVKEVHAAEGGHGEESEEHSEEGTESESEGEHAEEESDTSEGEATAEAEATEESH